MNSIKYIVGEKKLETKPLIFFNPLACDFLSELSQSVNSEWVNQYSKKFKSQELFDYTKKLFNK